ncbi:ATP-binding cassette domain-containing protein [Labrenzia sp. DG1229]|uniref:ATP-binding cassette domain-containing protein n=1 Tax=Labrenzia sp. DG1229 TaxID=681847 RepID=UPI00068D9975|nr:ATP-binding cassette domain-containing protein [Labrenzia sp. DG1229]
MGKVDATVATNQIQKSSHQSLLSLENATKTFGGTVAIKNVSFDVLPGEVLALLGENGAGKSTCVKLLAGVYVANEGAILVKGQPVHWTSPLDAQNAGIAVMHQHPGLFPDLSVAENIFFGQFRTNAFGAIDYQFMQRSATELLETVGLDISPDRPLKSLSVSEQQLVEIARALSADSDVLIMDEPTAALSQREVEKLFLVVERLKARGVGIIFVGHRMDEIFRVSDRVAVLRDGELLAVELAEDLSREDAIALMAGRKLSAIYPERTHQAGDVVLEVDALTAANQYQDISFSVRAGEIVGIGGLVGSGRTEVARTIFGVTKNSGGQIRIDGKPVRFKSPGHAMRHGIAYISEDRLSQSLIMDFPIRVNASLTVLEQCTRFGLLDRNKEINAVTEHLQRLKLRFAHYEQKISDLSGGNQQKVVLSKWLATRPRILILDEPTQGIDVQSKAEVHAMISDLAESGLAIVLISSEMPELLGMCDRIVVLREGKQAGEFDRKNASQEIILEAATHSDEPLGDVSADPNVVPISQSLTETEVPDPPPSFLKQVLARREIGLLVAILAIIIPVTLINPRMLSATNLTSLTMDAALLGIVALAQMMVILTRNIDLSVASVIGLAAYAAASLMHNNPDLPVLAAVFFSMFVGLIAGTINGVIIAYGRVPSIVATLGTMSVFRGSHSMVADGDQISADEVPTHWLELAGMDIAGIPLIVIISAILLGFAAFMLSRTKMGREIYAVGSNPEGADLIGVPAANRVFAAFVMAGVLAGLMGALWASRYATVDARVAFGYELTVIAAVVVGGVAIRGGSGTVLGIVLGALALLIIRNGLTLVRVDPLWLQGIYGLVILVAITIDARISKRNERLASMRAES